MKSILSLIFILAFITSGFCEEKFQWTRVKYLGYKIKSEHARWDSGMEYDLIFLDELEKNTTVKPDKKVNAATLDKLDEITKYPILFMTEEVDMEFTDVEVKNIREYCLRGGFVWADDCVYLAKGDMFFRSFIKTIETKVFPGRKMEPLSIEHPIFHCHFDMPKGLPYNQGSTDGAYGISDEKGRLMIIITAPDIHCGWFFGKDGKGHFGSKKITESIKMGINIVIYALTH